MPRKRNTQWLGKYEVHRNVQYQASACNRNRNLVFKSEQLNGNDGLAQLEHLLR